MRAACGAWAARKVLFCTIVHDTVLVRAAQVRTGVVAGVDMTRPVFMSSVVPIGARTQRAVVRARTPGARTSTRNGRAPPSCSP